MPAPLPPLGSSVEPQLSAFSGDLVAVPFWMNGCAQVAHVSREGLRRCRQDLLATGAVLLN
ncbi:hypothetical protein [Synechococcus sp. NOUM97013]|uniref:hypothetical protein n=1 Tax=Synechococcus sp. NOUM97013 TaxID=1442555 RepID=UPI001645D2B7|nr:hypothetical protein [Synechococcus sp. NOUM97013]QNI73116.1 hypothetical protein SynNOUM97013_01050 [Synechococcus sp. NOUM97013]